MNLNSNWMRVCSAWIVGTALGCGPKTPGGEDTTGGEDTGSSSESGSTGSGSTVPTGEAPTEPGQTSSTSQGQDTSAESTTNDTTGPGPTEEEIPSDPGPYLPGIDGFLIVEELRSFAGSTMIDGGAGARAQFFTAAGAQGFMTGLVLDPFEGVEDCGVFVFDTDGVGGGDDITFLGADEVHVEVAGAMLTMEHGSDPFYHWLGFDPQDDPAPGSRFAFEVRGGLVGDADLPGPVMPPELLFTAPDFGAPIGRGDLTLQWTGTGTEPLDLRLDIRDSPQGSRQWTEIRCRMTDDGSFTIPAAVLAAVPVDGFASIYVQRHIDEEQTDNGSTYLARGTSALDIHAGFGDACDSPPDNMTACAAAAEQINAVREACGLLPDPLANQCPTFLADLCVDCTGYYACVAAGWSCEPDGLHTDTGSCQCE
ncbi:hypothetical protein [Nannocystis radixulma]|uniref:Uncharacterized protein n=1 Tax=Nannocystis radixulma TaxID=2995305 RepID=A0ABT5B1R2_9BACT|nr:hypothetical protein [Nannocystis radixulma]MDC0668049.1 hypothetical protein [Nannocystis radixulma]